MTCMLACSLVHEGKESISLSRIQVIQNPFEAFPGDMRVALCRQCLSPACVEACPTGALHIDSNNGNVKTVDAEKCDGCKLCIEACSYQPHRLIWNHEEEHVLICDLCLNTPFWNEQGGPGGKQACVAVCPVGALQCTRETPAQEGDDGYEVNLRGRGWHMMGYPVD